MAANLKEKKPKYYLNAEGEFVIENYNFAKPFANFFPGIAGKYGIPMWVFYVNRAQGISSFGTKDKDHSIVEFFPANKAWQMVSSQGFRTFIKVSSGKKSLFYEPFHNGFTNLNFNLTNRMSISSSDLMLEEENLSLGLKIKVEYFNIPNDSYAGLSRIVTVKNLSRSAKKIQLLDGLPQIVPYGVSNLFLKKLGRTIEAWMRVENLHKGVPFYKINVDPTDRPEVVHIQEGNFYLGFYFDKGRAKIIRPIVDPELIFGPVTDFSCPQQFLRAEGLRFPQKEITTSKTPCGFLPLELKLKAGEEKTFYAVIGYMRSCAELNTAIKRITSADYLSRKAEENKKVIARLQQDIATSSSSQEFDLYAKQTYLDNILRGGYPIIFTANAQDSVFYLYSRKHGDLERDYNKFRLAPTYLSQGNGNYRDMNQNRRCDVWFNPAVKDENLIYFLNLIQTDGFNPLVIEGARFVLKNEANLKAILNDLVADGQSAKLAAYLEKPFTPGGLILFLQDYKIKLKVSYDDCLNILLSNCLKIQKAEHGEGFWTDHWTYNLDLLESYLGVYPENLKEIIFDKKVFTYYDNTETVRPRSEKYLTLNGSPRQLHAVSPDNAKREMIHKRSIWPHIVRSQYGKGEIYTTTLINKLLCLTANKLASLDPFGCGVEMEANKPNWYDALNGLPGLFGSSLCETLELKRLILFIQAALGQSGIKKIDLTEEIYDFLFHLDGLIQKYLESGLRDRDYHYWDKSYALKEDYRQKTRLGLSGKEREITTADLSVMLSRALDKLDAGIEKARDKTKGTYCAYFINTVADYEALKPPFIKPTKFVQKKAPLFLEAQVHALRLAQNLNQARALYQATKKSALFDKKLKMYKVTAPLASMPEEIGRCRVFTPGWLENESVWLHMEYKYLLELLKQGLVEEFYADFKNALIPFQNPQRYGRSILENSSFLVSSAFPDKKLHGNGFVARLSGSTAEFLQIWLMMNLGRSPFFLNSVNELNLTFKPLLAGWLFQRNGNYSYNFLSRIKVIYHNPKRKNTFGKNAAQPRKISFRDKAGALREFTSETIPSPYAEEARSCQIKQIDVYLE